MRNILTVAIIFVSAVCYAQTNIFPSSGNAGIGTTSPQFSLDILGWGQRIMNPSTTSYTTFRLYNDQNNGFRALEVAYSGSSYPGSLLNGSPAGEGGSIATTGAFPLSLGTSNTARMTILSNGNVGIGTPAPGATLDIRSSGTFLNFTTARGFSTSRNWGFITSLVAEGDFAILQSTTNSNTPTVSRIIVDPNGNVGIGNTNPDAKLAVSGQVHSQEVKVSVTVPGPDYVFEKDYKLASLEEIKNYIDQNKHLPEVPSAKDMEKNGVQLGEMNMLLLKKIEELTLYVIEQNKKIVLQQSRIDQQGREIKLLKENK